MRPKFGSAPKIAVLTRLDEMMARGGAPRLPRALGVGDTDLDELGRALAVDDDLLGQDWAT